VNDDDGYLASVITLHDEYGIIYPMNGMNARVERKNIKKGF